MTKAETGTNVRPGQALAVVVGAGGMGMAVARRLGERYRLLIADRDEEHLSRRVAALREEGYDVRSLICDVTDPGAVAGLAEAAAAQGPLRVLAHVVGLSPSMGDFRTIMRVNLVGATQVADAMLPLAREGTAALFVASLAAHSAPPGAPLLPILDDALAPNFMERLEAALDQGPTPTLAYCLSKAALIRLCQRRAAAWGRRGARIVSLSPGLIATPMGALEFEKQPMKYDLLNATPLKREGTMIEVADAVDFLTSDRASFISGIDLLIDGGLVAAMKYGG